MNKKSHSRGHEATHEREWVSRKLAAAIRAKEKKELEMLAKTSLKDLIH